MSQITTISDAVVELSSLYTAYENILIEAERQLSEMDATESQIERITAKVTSSSNFVSAVSKKAVEDLVDALREASEGELTSVGMRRFIAAIAKHVADHISREIDEYITQTVDHYLSTKIDDVFTNYIVDHPRVIESFEAHKALTHLTKFIELTKETTSK